MELLLSFVVLTASIWITARVLPGFEVRGVGGTALVAVGLGLLQFLIGWLVMNWPTYQRGRNHAGRTTAVRAERSPQRRIPRRSEAVSSVAASDVRVRTSKWPPHALKSCDAMRWWIPRSRG
jgi:hypothetical protein